MAFTIDKKNIIDYPPSNLKEFKVMTYECIDNLHFTLNPNECLANVDEYISIVKQRFLKEGWEGDGDIDLIWVPPFMLNNQKQGNLFRGVAVWHVKQINDGISWLLYPKGLFQ
jgi:hypothetical protein